MLVVGTPSACFLPARKHQFQYVSGLLSLEVPIRGSFPDDHSKAGAPYDICPEKGQMLFGTLLEVLFAFRKYPRLEDNQYFVISAVEEDENSLRVIGRAIEVVG
jgi:hypothetical protein